AHCRFCSEGVVVEHRLQRIACEHCVAAGPAPNAIALAYQQGPLVSRVVEAQVPNGADKPYRCSVAAAAALVTNKLRLRNGLALSVERGHATPAAAMAVADKHCAEERERALLEIAETAVLDQGADPREMAELLRGYGIIDVVAAKKEMLRGT
ncbi:MAG: hypothetical protein V2A58_17380, partial [Planctomycetota bacterium]